jgi:ATP diphosphatase
MSSSQRHYAITDLLSIMQRLRNPENGCPWDLEQTYASIAPHTLEEAYEVVDAIARNDMIDLKDELGDFLFQVVFYAQMAQEDGYFTFADVVQGICEKMIRRHPHIFADNTAIKSADDQTNSWEQIKAEERRLKAQAKGVAKEDAQPQSSALDGVTIGLPATTRALKLSQKAAKVGFDWDDIQDVVDKVHEEIEEVLTEARAPMQSQDRLEDEIGDVLFAVVNMARKLKVDPEAALRRTNKKFEQRFRYIEQQIAADNKDITKTPLAELEKHWQAAKKA